MRKRGREDKVVHILPLVLYPQVISQPAACSLWVASAGNRNSFRAFLLETKPKRFVESTFCLMRLALASSIFFLIFSFRYSSYANGWTMALACTLRERERGGREVRWRREGRKGRGEEV